MVKKRRFLRESEHYRGCRIKGAAFRPTLKFSPPMACYFWLPNHLRIAVLKFTLPLGKRVRKSLLSVYLVPQAVARFCLVAITNAAAAAQKAGMTVTRKRD